MQCNLQFTLYTCDALYVATETLGLPQPKSEEEQETNEPSNVAPPAVSERGLLGNVAYVIKLCLEDTAAALACRPIKGEPPPPRTNYADSAARKRCPATVSQRGMRSAVSVESIGAVVGTQDADKTTLTLGDEVYEAMRADVGEVGACAVRKEHRLGRLCCPRGLWLNIAVSWREMHLCCCR